MLLFPVSLVIIIIIILNENQGNYKNFLVTATFLI